MPNQKSIHIRVGVESGMLKQTQELLNPSMITLLAHQGAALVAFAQP
jgi:hypothetical protein